MLMKPIYLALNIRDMTAGSVDTCVVNMDPVSRREAWGRNKDLKDNYFCGCYDI